MATETTEVSHTSTVSGFSKSMCAALPYCALAIASLTRYDTPEETTIMMRIAKIHTSSWTWMFSTGTASRMKVMRATPVTP